jgi:hypothetical protein
MQKSQATPYRRPLLRRLGSEPRSALDCRIAAQGVSRARVRELLLAECDHEIHADVWLSVEGSDCPGR